MYVLSRLTQDFLDKHPKLYSMFGPCYFMLCGSTPHSYDLFRRTVFYGEKEAAAFVAADTGTKRITAVIVFNQFGKENDSIFMHIIPVEGAPLDANGMSEILKQIISEAVKKFDLNRIYSNVMDIEDFAKTALEKTGFCIEAEMKEQIFFMGQLRSVLVYTFSAKGRDNA